MKKLTFIIRQPVWNKERSLRNFRGDAAKNFRLIEEKDTMMLGPLTKKTVSEGALEQIVCKTAGKHDAGNEISNL